MTNLYRSRKLWSSANAGIVCLRRSWALAHATCCPVFASAVTIDESLERGLHFVGEQEQAMFGVVRRLYDVQRLWRLLLNLGVEHFPAQSSVNSCSEGSIHRPQLRQRESTLPIAYRGQASKCTRLHIFKMWLRWLWDTDLY